eukprot:TCONS_00013579-protein
MDNKAADIDSEFNGNEHTGTEVIDNNSVTPEVLAKQPCPTRKRRYQWYRINPDAIPSKLAYFFECGRRIGFNPNLILFFTSIGLNKAESGFIIGLRMIGMILGAPFWGLIADKWQCHRTVIILMTISTLLAITTQPFISVFYGDPDMNQCPYQKINTKSTTLNNSIELLSNCKTCYNSTFSNNSKSYLSNVENTQNNTPERFGALFLAMFSISLWLSFAEGSSIAFIDTGTLRRSQLSTQRKFVYGHQRMFSAIGGAVGIFTANLAVDYFPQAAITCYTGIFGVYAFYTIFYALFTIILYRGLTFKEVSSNQGSNMENKTTNDTENPSLGIEHQGDNHTCGDNKTIKDKKKLHRILIQSLRKPDVIFLYVTTFVSGLVYSQHTSFLYVYLKELDAPSILLTLSIIFSNISSIFGFFFAQKVINLLGGTWRTIPVTFAFYFIRYCGVGLIKNPWLVLIFQPLHAVTATLYVANGLTYLKETSPLPVITTLVSLFNTTHYGLGTIVGSSLSGLIYEKYG